MTEPGPLDVFVIAGEASGDELGRKLMAALKIEAKGHVTFRGVGGRGMAGEGLTTLFPISDIALVGFDDLALASAIEPPLTTVRQPVERLGYLAASTMIDLLESNPAERDRIGAQHIVLPTELVVRASCGQALRFAANARQVANTISEGGVAAK